MLLESLLVLAAPQPDTTAIQVIQEQSIVQTKEPTKYKVKENDTLIKIGKSFNVNWERIWAKNKQLKNQDQLEVGDVLVIPDPDEKLKPRKLIMPTYSRNVSVGARNGSRAGSGWYPAYSCTGYVASRRAVGQWGNASEWLWQARRDGWATGSTPKAGSIGWTYGHVVYIEKVSGDRVYLSERNYDWNGSYRERWASASDFTYIY